MPPVVASFIYWSLIAVLLLCDFRRRPSFTLTIWIPTLLLGILASTIAALVPARTNARVPVLAALAGRRPLRPVPSELVEAWTDALAAAGFPDDEVELLLIDDDPTARLPQWGLHLGPYDTTQDLAQLRTYRLARWILRLVGV